MGRRSETVEYGGMGGEIGTGWPKVKGGGREKIRFQGRCHGLFGVQLLESDQGGRDVEQEEKR